MAEGKKKILLVDDNLFLLGLLAKAFEHEGFTAFEAASAEHALLLLEKERPEIILSDYEMPGMDGFAFRKHLLGNATTKNIPFVFLTAHNNTELVMEGLDELMAVDFIDKGTPVQVIVAKIDNLLSTVREKQALSLLELRKAAEAINVKSVPAKTPTINGFEIDFWHKPYQGYPGGDFIDFIRIGTRYTCVVLGDVMGKKWTAWFFTFSFLSYIRAAVRFCVSSGEYDPAVILQKTNQVVCEDEALVDVLSSLSLILVDEQTGHLAYAGAGDLPLLYFNSAEGVLTSIKTSGLLLGLFSSAKYDATSITLQKNDQILIFSDGLIESVAADRHTSNYGLFKENICPFLRHKNGFAAVKDHLSQTFTDATQADDCSIISIIKK